MAGRAKQEILASAAIRVYSGSGGVSSRRRSNRVEQMGTLSAISRVSVYPLSIPLRKPFGHAAHVRTSADPVIVEIELLDGTCGYGETLARSYVSGETVSTVVGSIRDVFANELLAFHPTRFSEALEVIDLLPCVDDNGETIVAARAAVELALLDAYSKHFKKPISEAVGWLGLPWFGPPGSTSKLRYSGVVSGEPEDYGAACG